MRHRSKLGSPLGVMMLLGACTGSPLPATDGGSSETGSPPVPDSPPQIELFELYPAPIKRFEFEWLVDGASDLQLLERHDPLAAFEPVAAMLGDTSATLTVPLHLRAHAGYRLRACNELGCVESDPVEVGGVEPAIGFIKSPAPRYNGLFGSALVLSGDGRTLAVREQIDDAWVEIIHVYVLDPVSGMWSLDTSLSLEPGDDIWRALALTGDGRTLVIGARGEAGGSLGIGGDPTDDSAPNSGAVYVYERDPDDGWALAAYIKASNADAGDYFGIMVAIDRSGDTLVVGADFERAFPAGASSDPQDDSSPQAGAVYVFERGANGLWTEQHYLKEPTYTSSAERFGWQVQLDAAGQLLVVSTLHTIYTYTRMAEGWQLDDMLELPTVGYKNPTLSPDGQRMVVAHTDRPVDDVYDAGFVTLYRRAADGGWDEDTELLPPIPGEQDRFGGAVAFDHDGRLLLIGARGEDSPATGVDGSQADDSSERAGAAYLFERDVVTDAWSLRSFQRSTDMHTTPIR